MSTFEKHYRPKDLAELWGLSPKTIGRLFAFEPGVIRVSNEGKGKRAYATLSIPQSVALRVHDRLSRVPVKASVPTGRAPRIIRLRGER
jgi:hypothetical protein